MLNGIYLPVDLKICESKSLALKALSETFFRIAESEGIKESDLGSAIIVFGFKIDSWPYFCEVSVTSKCGSTMKVKVDSMGNKFNMVNELIYRYS
ncbi:hypothetical protein [Pseudoalteromonas luteoviolacea]|uniref:hypothetical protein n=1 Tax=Pseudoalteromonas luteoviolacea TaxID=43657 RepID=UPI0011AB614D|nr:hypothetical protein [Pseudoalteromonas luteoviolacea]